MKLFIIGVTNWEFIINDQKIDIKYVIEEDVKYTADGIITIKIQNATIDMNLFELFKKGNNVSSIKQSFQLRDHVGSLVDTIEWEYNNLIIVTMSLTGMCDGAGTLDIVLSN
jgi:hypothetical protein